MKVEVVYGTADRQELIELEVEPGTTLIEAVRASAIIDRFPGAFPEGFLDDPEATKNPGDFPSKSVNQVSMGVFGSIDPPDRILEEWDRVEIYRPLLIDPKEARRQRAKNK